MITIQRYKNYVIIQIYLLSFLPNKIPDTSGPKSDDGDPDPVSILFGIVIHVPINIKTGQTCPPILGHKKTPTN